MIDVKKVDRLFAVVLISVILALVAFDAQAAKFFLTGNDLPGFIDGTKQNSIEISGSAIGANFSDIRITADWIDLHQKDVSPPLVLENINHFKHSFSIGGQKCGYVVFSASARVSNVTFDSDQRQTFVDCYPPRVLVAKPVEGQMVKAGARMPVEVRVEDDSIVHSVARTRSIVCPFRIEVDGETAESSELSFVKLQQPLKFNIGIPGEGRHGVRISINDPTGKSGEKTLWVNADGTPPAVRIVSPTNNQQVAATSGHLPSITVTVESTDLGTIASGISKVEFYLDGIGVAVARSSSGGNQYTATFGVTEGQKVVKVKAFDKVDNVSEASVHITVAIAGKPAPKGPPPAAPRTMPLKP